MPRIADLSRYGAPLLVLAAGLVVLELVLPGSVQRWTGLPWAVGVPLVAGFVCLCTSTRA